MKKILLTLLIGGVAIPAFARDCYVVVNKAGTFNERLVENSVTALLNKYVENIKPAPMGGLNMFKKYECLYQIGVSESRDGISVSISGPVNGLGLSTRFGVSGLNQGLLKAVYKGMREEPKKKELCAGYPKMLRWECATPEERVAIKEEEDRARRENQKTGVIAKATDDPGLEPGVVDINKIKIPKNDSLAIPLNKKMNRVSAALEGRKWKVYLNSRKNKIILPEEGMLGNFPKPFSITFRDRTGREATVRGYASLDVTRRELLRYVYTQSIAAQTGNPADTMYISVRGPLEINSADLGTIRSFPRAIQFKEPLTGMANSIDEPILMEFRL